MRAETITTGRTSILFDADAASAVVDDHFEPAWWERSGKLLGKATGRGQVCFVQWESQVWALRHYRRGGWMARLAEDAYCWSGLAHTRPWREWQLTARLHEQGLPVPQPVAARVVRLGLLYRGDLITRRIDGAQALADVLAARPLTPAGWRELGRTLRRFHDAGVRHDDINARNVLVGEGAQFHLIDFDKAAIVGAGAWQARNLARFRRSLDKVTAQEPAFRFTPADWQALLDGYGESRA